MNSLARIIAICPIVAIATAAETRDWYVINFADGKCLQAKRNPDLEGSPEGFHRALRSEGTADQVHVQKDDDGNLLYVVIRVVRDGGTTSLFWFPSEKNCEIGRRGLLRNGVIPNDEDLK